jgi:hypothetical protein
MQNLNNTSLVEAIYLQHFFLSHRVETYFLNEHSVLSSGLGRIYYEYK